MLLCSFLQQLEPTFSPGETKIHLARFNGIERPVDVFIEGRFDEWQLWQRRRNFSRQFVLSLIDVGVGRWLYAGLFRSLGCKDVAHPEPHVMYDLERVRSADEFSGRLFVTSAYKERNSYVYGETLSDDLALAELLPERVSFGRFPGF
jgi:hypothetical protein